MAKKKKKKQKTPKPNSIPVTERESRRVEPDEWYRAEFLEADIGEGQYGPWVRLNFELKNGYFEDSKKKAKGWKVGAFMNAQASEGSPLFIFATVMKGKEPKIGKRLDLTVYYGNKYMVFVEDKTNKKTKEVRQAVTKIKKIKKKK